MRQRGGPNWPLKGHFQTFSLAESCPKPGVGPQCGGRPGAPWGDVLLGVPGPTRFSSWKSLHNKETGTLKMFNKKQFYLQNTSCTVWWLACMVLTENLVFIHGMKNSVRVCVPLDLKTWHTRLLSENEKITEALSYFFYKLRFFLSTLLLSLKRSQEKNKINTQVDQQEGTTSVNLKHIRPENRFWLLGKNRVHFRSSWLFTYRLTHMPQALYSAFVK